MVDDDDGDGDEARLASICLRSVLLFTGRMNRTKKGDTVAKNFHIDRRCRVDLQGSPQVLFCLTETFCRHGLSIVYRHTYLYNQQNWLAASDASPSFFSKHLLCAWGNSVLPPGLRRQHWIRHEGCDGKAFFNLKCLMHFDARLFLTQAHKSNRACLIEHRFWIRR